MTEKPMKDERLEIRLTAAEKTSIYEAAEQSNQSISDYVRGTAIPSGSQIENNFVVQLSYNES